MNIRLFIAFLLIIGSPAFAAPTAVAKSGYQSWYTGNANSGRAPYPVFLEGHESTPREGAGKIVDYEWNFGDGSPNRKGFSCAHIYETAGVYTVTLTVTDENSLTDTDSFNVTVTDHPNNFYFNAATGDDANNGLTPETAWKTGAKLKTLLESSARPLNNSTVYFERGGTYYIPPGVNPYTSTSQQTWKPRGTGDPPVLKRLGTLATSMFNMSVNGDFARNSFVDLTFDGESAQFSGVLTTRTSNTAGVITLDSGHGVVTSGDIYVQWAGGERKRINGTLSGDTLTLANRSDGDTSGDVFPAVNTAVTVTGRGNIFDAKARSYQLNWVRCSFENSHQSIVINRSDLPHPSWGFFVYDCNFDDSYSIHMYWKCGRVAMWDNIITNSNNHNVYGAWVDGGYFYNNQFSNARYDRVCMRFDGATGDFARPAQNIVCRNNTFTGNFNVAAGRWTLQLAGINPNTTTDQSIEWVDWSYNTMTDAEILMNFTSCSNVTFSHNTLTSTSDTSTSAGRITLNKAGTFPRRPIVNLTISNNTITTNPTGSWRRVFGLSSYNAATWNGLDEHTGVVILDNTINFSAIPVDNRIYGLFYEGFTLQEIQDGFTTQNTWTGRNRASDPMVTTDNSTTLTLDEWFALTGDEGPPDDPPPPSPPNAPNGVTAVGDGDSILLTWFDPPSITEIRVKRSTSLGGPYTLIDTVAPGVQQFDDTTVLQDTPYYYVLTAYSSVTELESENSLEVTGESPTDPTPPPAPSRRVLIRLTP